MLTQQLHELEEKISEQGATLSGLQNEHDRALDEVKLKHQSEEIELLKLRKECRVQKEDIERLMQETSDGDALREEMSHQHKEEIHQQEEAFNEERSNLKERLHEVHILTVPSVGAMYFLILWHLIHIMHLNIDT